MLSGRKKSSKKSHSLAISALLLFCFYLQNDKLRFFQQFPPSRPLFKPELITLLKNSPFCNWHGLAMNKCFSIGTVAMKSSVLLGRFSVGLHKTKFFRTHQPYQIRFGQYWFPSRDRFNFNSILIIWKQFPFDYSLPKYSIWKNNDNFNDIDL